MVEYNQGGSLNNGATLANLKNLNKLGRFWVTKRLQIVLEKKLKKEFFLKKVLKSKTSLKKINLTKNNSNNYLICSKNLIFYEKPLKKLLQKVKRLKQKKLLERKKNTK